jgi:hypothetical protein
MAKKYKISENNLQEFWGLFTNKKTPEKLQAIVNNDPVLKKLQSDLRNIHDKATDYLDTVKKEEPEIYQYLQKNGFIK